MLMMMIIIIRKKGVALVSQYVVLYCAVVCHRRIDYSNMAYFFVVSSAMIVAPNRFITFALPFHCHPIIAHKIAFHSIIASHHFASFHITFNSQFT